jgi:hypothetical protein
LSIEINPLDEREEVKQKKKRKEKAGESAIFRVLVNRVTAAHKTIALQPPAFFTLHSAH